jgi:hypothetical protein
MSPPSNFPAPEPDPMSRKARARELARAQRLTLQLVRTLALARAQGLEQAQELGRARALELAGNVTRTLERLWGLAGGLDHELAVARKLIGELTRSQAADVAVAEREAVGLALHLATARQQERAQPRRRLEDRLVDLAAAILPAGHRPRYREEWFAELEALEHDRQPLLGFAFWTLVSAPSLAAVLRTGGWRRSVVRWLGRLVRWSGRAGPLAQGLLSAAAVLAAALAGILHGALRYLFAALAAAAAGVLTFFQTRNQ